MIENLETLISLYKEGTMMEVSTELKICWDCHSSHNSANDLNEKVKDGEDVLPVEASFRIVRSHAAPDGVFDEYSQAQSAAAPWVGEEGQT